VPLVDDAVQPALGGPGFDGGEALLWILEFLQITLEA
jgi:hypothetical protein